LKIYKAPKVVKASAIARTITIGGKRRGKGHFIVPPRGYFYNQASGLMEERPKGKLNIATGFHEER